MNERIYSVGRLQVQIDWGKDTWYYRNQENEKINMGLFIGSVVPPEGDTKLYQVIVGPLMISWGWQS